MNNFYWPKKKLNIIPNWIIKVKKLFYSKKVLYWCNLKYPGHQKGCPMYGIRDKCPPAAPYITDIFDIEKNMYIVHSEFDLEKHVNKMKIKHPDWTERQLRNCLYWQGTSRKQLKKRVEKAMLLLRTNIFTLMPHASGVQVYRTCKHSGLILEKINNKMKINRHVALLGWKK